VGFSYPVLTAGQTLIVDAGARTATISGSSVRASLTLLSPNAPTEWFRVRAGTDTFTVTGDPPSVSIVHTPSYT
jgi:hypothetical protein